MCLMYNMCVIHILSSTMSFNMQDYFTMYEMDHFQE